MNRLSKQKIIKIQFISYPVRLSDVLHILISATAICLMALTSGPMAIASKVQTLASALIFRP